MDTVTAGRNVLWPMVIDKIAENPILGHGRSAMERTGLSADIAGDSDERGPDTPHSAYLEMLLDNGWIGLAISLALFGYILVNSLSLTVDRRSPVFAAIGGLSAALVIAQLVGSITGQSFYPREGTFGMWCAIGLLLRVSVERDHGNLSFALPGRAIERSAPIRSPEWWRPTDSSRPDRPMPVGSTSPPSGFTSIKRVP